MFLPSCSPTTQNRPPKCSVAGCTSGSLRPWCPPLRDEVPSLYLTLRVASSKCEQLIIHPTVSTSPEWLDTKILWRTSQNLSKRRLQISCPPFLHTRGLAILTGGRDGECDGRSTALRIGVETINFCTLVRTKV